MYYILSYRQTEGHGDGSCSGRLLVNGWLDR